MSGRILAVDTTGEHGSIALIDDGCVIEECALHSPDGFGHVLFDSIGQLLARRGWTLRDIDVFASASGPGSFTGVRVGLAAVKGLATATGRKVIAISNLQALAWFGTRPLRAVILDARRGEIFGAVYDSNLRVVCPEVVLGLDKWLATLPSGDIEFITAGYEAEFPSPVIRAPLVQAGAIGAIASSRMENARDPQEIDANYVRRSDAELHWRD